MKRLILTFSLALCVASSGYALTPGEEADLKMARSFGPVPNFKAHVLTGTSRIPFKTNDVATTPSKSDDEANAANRRREAVTDARSLLNGHLISAVTFGTVPMVMIDGETFAVGDVIEFPDGKGGLMAPGANVKLRLKKIVKSGHLVIEMTQIGNDTNPVEFDHELPKELKDLL